MRFNPGVGYECPALQSIKYSLQHSIVANLFISFALLRVGNPDIGHAAYGFAVYGFSGISVPVYPKDITAKSIVERA